MVQGLPCGFDRITEHRDLLVDDITKFKIIMLWHNTTLNLIEKKSQVPHGTVRKRGAMKSNVTTTNNMWWGINRIVKQVKVKFFGQ